jgi:hypothetical protein
MRITIKALNEKGTKALSDLLKQKAFGYKMIKILSDPLTCDLTLAMSAKLPSTQIIIDAIKPVVENQIMLKAGAELKDYELRFQ